MAFFDRFYNTYFILKRDNLPGHYRQVAFKERRPLKQVLLYLCYVLLIKKGK